MAEIEDHAIEATASADWEVVIVGGGLAGLSAAIYLGRALRRTLVVDSGHSLAAWEPHVQNYLGFPDGIAGEDLLRLGRVQAGRYNIQLKKDTILDAVRREDGFLLRGKHDSYSCQSLLIATGLYHLPPEVSAVNECLGKSMFFCKDCDAYRVRERRIIILGSNDEAVEYALAMLSYSSCVVVATNGKREVWSKRHASWLREYEIPVYSNPITDIEHDCGHVRSITFKDGSRVAVDCIFTTRGDVYHNSLAKALGAATDEQGQISVNECMRTTVPGVYAAGCVTPANCQMIVAAGEGATAAQAINRDLFEQSLQNHTLRRFRAFQLETAQTSPEALPN